MGALAITGGQPVRTAPWPKWPVFDGTEEQALLEVFRSGNWWRHAYGQGVELNEDELAPQSAVARFQRDFAQAHDCRYGICAANGTVTLEIALRAAGVKPGDEVIVPPYTFIATASSVLMVGAVPIFADIDPDTYNLDARRVREAVSERTRAIIPVHFGGQPCDMDAINEIAIEHQLTVIEDAAHAHGASYRDRKCGSLGDLASFSFQLSKNMTAGEGGIITTNEAAYAEMCETLVWGGRKKGQPWYCHFVLASNARMTEFQGAILSAQLARLPRQVAQRQANGRLLDSLLSQIEGISPLTTLPTTTGHAYHIYMFRYSPQAFGGLPKAKFVQALQAEGIEGAFAGYIWPLYRNPMFLEKNFMGGAYPVAPPLYEREINYGDFEELCPVSERACTSEAVWLPQSMLLADGDSMQDIAQAIRKVQINVKELLD